MLLSYFSDEAIYICFCIAKFFGLGFSVGKDALPFLLIDITFESIDDDVVNRTLLVTCKILHVPPVTWKER